MVSVDIYLNETTRHADIILPPATGLETPHLGIAFHNLAIHNSIKYSEAVIEKEAGTKYDWEIFAGLVNAMKEVKKDESIPTINYSLEQMLGMTLSRSGAKFDLEKLKKEPHGIDLGPLQTTIKSRLKNKSGRIDIYPEIYKEAIGDLLAKNDEEDGLLLIGRRHLRSNNSWLHNSYRMVKGKERCTLLIHPKDAAENDIENDELVEVQSNVGKERIKAEISDEVMVGTVSIPHGWGHNRTGTKMEIAEAHAGISMNDLVDDFVVDPLSGVSVINGIPVTIAKLEKACH